MKFLKSIGLVLLLFLFFQCKGEKKQLVDKKPIDQETPKILESVFIDSVWAANMVSFDLQTIGTKQYVAYYNKNRMMTVAVRDTNSNNWEKKVLPNKLVWDSHNYVVLGFDESGSIHVSGNMHNVPLVYFKSDKPFDIQSLRETNYMVGQDEQHVTYPKFLNDEEGHLYYLYRTGGSGSGNNWVNRYNSEEGVWERYLNTNLFEGIGDKERRSAYFSLKKGRDGKFHCTWVWRWTPLVETTHQLCYAVSKDLKHWENANGESVRLPLKPDNTKLIVDNAPTKGGMHNGKYQLFLTAEEKPIIAYLKYDENGFTQIYLAIFLNGKWVTEKISDWNFRWEFVGGGDKMTEGANFSLESDPTDNQNIVIKWSNETGSSGVYMVNAETLEKINKEVKIKDKYPSDLKARITKDPELHVNIRDGRNTNNKADKKYVLKWESKGKSHGSQAPEVIPDVPLSPLYLVSFKK